MKILITGGAGFIGAALGGYLLKRGDTVVAIDNLSDYYEVSLKQARLDHLRYNYLQHNASSQENFSFLQLDIADRNALQNLFATQQFDAVVHLAAQAGVRYSIENPFAYIDANLVGFGNILEGCRHAKIEHLIFASSSSVYGGNKQLPFNENHAVDHPLSLYAATKKANELMAHSYAHLYDLPCTGLRFFTVYGPWGRPDMAFFKFTKLILNGEPIPIFNNGNLTRDFTYIDDVVEAVARVIDKPPQANPNFDHASPTPASSTAGYQLFNIGNGKRVNLMDYIHALEQALERKAQYQMLPMQPGDVEATTADLQRLEEYFDFKPTTDIATGLGNFVAWYKTYYQIS